MSKWITDEANAHNEKMEQKRFEKRLIQESNYWSRLVRQVEADVVTTNEHPYWKPALANLPLQFGQEADGSGYQVSKSGYPAVIITFRNEGRRILIEREFIDNEQIVQTFGVEEELLIGTSGNNVVLRGENKLTLVTFEDASRHILKPIIETVKAAIEEREK